MTTPTMTLDEYIKRIIVPMTVAWEERYPDPHCVIGKVTYKPVTAVRVKLPPPDWRL